MATVWPTSRTMSTLYCSTKNSIKLPDLFTGPFRYKRVCSLQLVRSVSTIEHQGNEREGECRLENSEADEEQQEQQRQIMLEALKRRKTEEAWKLFQQMKKSGICAGTVCISRLVAQLCHEGSVASVAKAQDIVQDILQKHQADALNGELLIDEDALGLLVVASAKIGAAHYSLGILRFMFECGYYPNVKVWSSVVARLGRSQEDAGLALQLFDEACSEAARMIGKSWAQDELQEEITGSDGSSEAVSLRLILLPRPVGNFNDSAFRSTLPDTGAFNAALNACANAGLAGRARQIWDSMPIFDLRPNTNTFNIMLKVHARAGRLDLVEATAEAMEAAGVEPNSSTVNSLVAAYIGAANIDKAELVLKSLQGKLSKNQPADKLTTLMTKWSSTYQAKLGPDVWMYTTLMKGYVQQGRVRDAMQLLLDMQRNSSSSQQEDARAPAPNEVTFTTAIRACTRMGLIVEARKILEEMARQGVAANTITYNTLLQGICSIPDMKAASSVLEVDMSEAGVRPDAVTYNTLINGYLRAGDKEAALTTFRSMREAKIAPSRVTYGTLMKAFAQDGKPELAARVLGDMMKDPRVRVDAVAWSIMVDAYSRAGLEQEAKKAFEEMKRRGFKPSNATYCTLVKAYQRSRNYGELLLLWKEVKHRALGIDGYSDFRPDEALLDALIDAFVRGAYFQKALQVVECMEREGMQSSRAKAKYKRLYVELYANLYTSPHRSQARRARSAQRRRAVEAFKFWLGLPNKLYGVDWNLDDDQF